MADINVMHTDVPGTVYLVDSESLVNLQGTGTLIRWYSQP